jgi:hypothetical protein
MNDLQFAGKYQYLPIRCSGRLISLQNEHLYISLYIVVVCITVLVYWGSSPSPRSSYIGSEGLVAVDLSGVGLLVPRRTPNLEDQGK